jgi:hypothetical protein
MKKALIALLTFFALFKIACAQDFSYGEISTGDLKMGRYAKDTSAHALVLQEYAKASIVVAADDEIKLMLEYHEKIKIFDNKGFDDATKALKVRNTSDNDSREEIETVKGTTYFLDGEGSIKTAEFDPSKIYTTRDYKEQSTSKFTMPALSPGCIIEIKYTFFSPFTFFLEHFHTWNFQSDIPKVYSEFEAVIPGLFTYNATLHGFLKLSKSDAQLEPKCFSSHGVESDCSDIKYGMKDIPAFIEEDYMTSPKNYISSITFDLVEFTNPYTRATNRETKEWRDIDVSLKQDDDFGVQLKKTSVFKDRMVPVVAGLTTDLDKAKAIYAYIQSNFKWNDYIGYNAYLGVKKAYEQHTGSIGDINISLTDALNSAGVSAQAVLLSTRDNGTVNDLYPAKNVFNYVIAMVTIGDKSYFLDATEPLLPFGMLPLKCLNSRGRVFSLDKPSYWVDLNLLQKEVSTTNLDLTLQDDGTFKGTMVRYSIGYQAFETRQVIKKYNSVDEYVEALAANYPRLKILKSEITDSDSLDKPVVEKYDVQMKILDPSNSGRYSFNPFFLSKITTNPFKLTVRTYPIDMGMPEDYRSILTIHLPANYKIESPPQNTTLLLVNNGGRFLTDYQADNNVFTFSHIIQFTKSIYYPEEYSDLKDFYNKIIQSEKAEMIIEKK